MDSVGVRVVPRKSLKNSDRLPVIDPCRATDKTLLKKLPDAMRSGLIQPLADQLA
jgi:hypothetical protein